MPFLPAGISICVENVEIYSMTVKEAGGIDTVGLHKTLISIQYLQFLHTIDHFKVDEFKNCKFQTNFKFSFSRGGEQAMLSFDLKTLAIFFPFLE